MTEHPYKPGDMDGEEFCEHRPYRGSSFQCGRPSADPIHVA